MELEVGLTREDTLDVVVEADTFGRVGIGGGRVLP